MEKGASFTSKVRWILIGRHCFYPPSDGPRNDFATVVVVVTIRMLRIPLISSSYFSVWTALKRLPPHLKGKWPRSQSKVSGSLFTARLSHNSHHGAVFGFIPHLLAIRSFCVDASPHLFVFYRNQLNSDSQICDNVDNVVLRVVPLIPTQHIISLTTVSHTHTSRCFLSFFFFSLNLYFSQYSPASFLQFGSWCWKLRSRERKFIRLDYDTGPLLVFDVCKIHRNWLISLCRFLYKMLSFFFKRERGDLESGTRRIKKIKEHGDCECVPRLFC